MSQRDICAICTDSHTKHNNARGAERSIVECQIWFYVSNHRALKCSIFVDISTMNNGFYLKVNVDYNVIVFNPIMTKIIPNYTGLSKKNGRDLKPL